MSSSDSEQEASGSRKPATKRQRASLACDMCKKRKIRCDGKVAGGKCSNCHDFEWKCTYENATKKYPSGYVQALQSKIAKLEALLQELHPGEDFTARVGIALTRTNWMRKGVLGDDSGLDNPSVFAAASSNPTVAASHSPATSSQSPDALSFQPLLGDPKPSSGTDANGEGYDVVVKLNQLSLLSSKLKQTHVGNYYGKSSNRALIMNSFALFKELNSAPSAEDCPPELQLMRSEFWENQPWETQFTTTAMRDQRFPEPDLLAQLVDLYFNRINIGIPILHEPLFRQNLRNQLHLKSWEFGAVVLLVCANGARYSDDPRVHLPGSDTAHSAGYEWFAQVGSASTITLSSDASSLQATALGVLYLAGKSEVAAWNMCGAGIRLAQNLGIHRKPAYNAEPSMNDELFKRPFWTLILFDRWLSSTLGRACAIVDDDLDLEYPVDCDDMYWMPVDGSPPFKQPEGRFSRVSSFIWLLKLSQILASALRTIHASDKTKEHHGFTGPEWEQRTVAYYDSTLNEWLESLPRHLRWDPNCEYPVLLLHSATLIARFYETQIIIHRPSIASQQASVLPSLAICTNAARSCAHIIDVVRRRLPGRAPHLYSCAFTAGVVLLFGIGTAKRSGSPIKPDDLQCVQSCMDYLKGLESRWQSAARIWDSLNIIVSLGRLPLNSQPAGGQKRPRSDDDDHHVTRERPWTGPSGSHQPDTTPPMDSSIWDAAGSSLLGLAPDVDTHWLGQLDQTNLLGGFDFSAILGSGGGQDALHGDSLSTHGPFGSDSGLSTSGMNPLQPLSHDLFAGINGVYSGVSPADSESSNADQSDRDRLNPMVPWQHLFAGYDGRRTGDPPVERPWDRNA